MLKKLESLFPKNVGDIEIKFKVGFFDFDYTIKITYEKIYIYSS